MGSVRDYDSAQAELVHVSGSRMGNEPVFEQDRVVIEDLAVIERRDGVYLLKALTEIPVEVSGELLREKILQFGDRVVVGPTQLEFRRIESGAAVASAARRRRLLSTLLIVLAATTGLLFVTDLLLRLQVSGPEVEKPADAAVSIPRGRPARAEATVAQRIAAARLAFAAAERYEAEARSVESYQFNAVRLWQGVVHELHGIEPAPPIAASAKERLQSAMDQLRSRLEYLKRNAYVAHAVEEDADLRLILREIMATVPDPANEQYWQWARDKLIEMGAY
jgi:hypothetical protein